MPGELETLVLSSLIAFPFAAIGVFYFWEQYLLPRLKTRRGNVKISRILPSGHFKDFWVKPKEESSEQIVNATDKEGNPIVEEYFDAKGNKTFRNKTVSINETGYFFRIGKNEDAERLPFIDSPDTVYFQGPVKRAFYDAEGNQISINKALKVPPLVGPKMLESLAARTWNAARATAFADKKNLYMMVLVGALAAIGAAFIGAIVLQTMGDMSDKINALSSQVSNMRAVIETIRVATGG